MKTTNVNYRLLLFLIGLFLLDECTFILYNLSFFQFLCSNTVGFFLTNEIPFRMERMYPFSVVYLSNIEQLPFLQVTNMITDTFISMDKDNMYYENTMRFIHLSDIDKWGDSTVEQDSLFYKVKLEATNAKKKIVQFYPLNNYVYTVPGEASLIFYRFENLTNHFLHSISIYVTLPSEAINHITKIQCFCYEELMIAPNEVVDLPILFMVEPSIINEYYNEMTINYILLIRDERNQ
jgi:hypothetical protein